MQTLLEVHLQYNKSTSCFGFRRLNQDFSRRVNQGFNIVKPMLRGWDHEEPKKHCLEVLLEEPSCARV